MPCYVPPEGHMLLLDLTMESIKCCRYSLNIRSCFTFLISMLKSFKSWHMTLVLLTKLWTIPLFKWRRWSDLKCKKSPVWVGFFYHFMVKLWSLFMIKTSKKGRVLLISNFSVNLVVDLRLMRRRINYYSPAGSCSSTSSIYLSQQWVCGLQYPVLFPESVLYICSWPLATMSFPFTLHISLWLNLS